MNTRFESLYNLPNMLYSQDSPIIIVAGALLKDNASGSVIAQLKYQSVSNKVISALKIEILPMDVTMQISDEKVEYQYLDLNISNGQTFGSNKAIIMPLNTIRSFSVNSIKVVFADGTQWSSSNSFFSLKQAKELKDEIKNDEIIKQYQIETSSCAKYIPIEDKGLWCCSCGAWNNKNTCTECSLSKTRVFEAYDFDKLKKSMDIRIAEEMEEQARIEEENELKKRKIKRILKILIWIMVAIAIVIAVIAAQPYILKWKINSTIEKGKYFIALEYIEKVDDEQEASNLFEKVKTSMYEDVLKAIEDKDYALGAELTHTYEEYIDFNRCIKLVQGICPHENVSVESKKETCEEAGYSMKKCDLCDFTVERINYPATGHNFTEKIDKEVTCVTDGNKHLTCNNCGMEKDDKLAKLGHNYGKQESIKPTCDKEGEYLYTCTRCSDKYTEKIKAKGHNFKEPTCTEDGVCTTCGAKGKGALGHKWDEFLPTCTRCSADYPVNINFTGLPSSGSLSGVTITQVHAKVNRVYYSSDTVSMSIWFSGVNNGEGTYEVSVEFYNSSGEYLTWERFWIGNSTNFESVNEYILLSPNETYTVKVKY